MGTIWNNRRQFSRRSVHRPQNAIIHGGPKGAYSMVLSATYSVIDRGEEFDFLGEGGRDPKTKKLVVCIYLNCYDDDCNISDFIYHPLVIFCNLLNTC